MAINKIVLNTEKGEQVLVDLTGDTVKPYRLAAGCTAHDASGNPITGVLEIITPKIHLDQGAMYAPGVSAYYTPRTITDFSINFYYYGASGCEQIVYPITGLAVGHTYTIEFEETYNGGFIGDAYQYGCGIMQEAEYKATTFPVNAGKMSCVTWTTASNGTQKGSVTFTANTSKAYWVWNMSRCNDGTRHDITFSTKLQAAGLTLQDKTVTQNGTFTADKGYSGLGSVTVNVSTSKPNLQDKTVTQNGSVTADSGYDGLGKVTVNVPTNSAKLQTRNVTITSNGIQSIYPESGYDGMSQVAVTVDVATGGGSNGVYENYNCVSISDSAIMRCDTLKSVTYTTAESIGDNAFYSCAELTSVKFPAVKSIGKSAFSYCKKLTIADFSALESIDKAAFMSCSSLVTLILRGNTLPTLNYADAFISTPFSSGAGYIYVPASMIAAYSKNTSNWWNYQGRYRALESYTVDGTTTGELDPSKI